MNHRALLSAVTAVALGLGCRRSNARIACTPGKFSACFGTEVTFQALPGDSTRITIRIQDLQGTVSQDNTAWSQLLDVRVWRGGPPLLGFPNFGPILPTWTPQVQPLGPGAPGSGWHNGGINMPEVSYSEWLAIGGTYGQNVGYVSGKDVSYNQAANTGSGLRTYTAPGVFPGWVTFSFVAAHHVTASDVLVELAAWVSDKPATSLPVPQEVGCILINGGSNPFVCKFFPYNLP